MQIDAGLPISYGTPAVLILLNPLRRTGKEFMPEYGTTNYLIDCVMGDYQAQFFRPAAFPIFGSYDSYGRIENIKEDDNTKALEEFYGLPIQDICNVVTSNRKDDGLDGDLQVIKDKSQPDEFGKPIYLEKYKILLGISATWMRRDVYYNLASTVDSSYYEELYDKTLPAMLKDRCFGEDEQIYKMLLSFDYCKIEPITEHYYQCIKKNGHGYLRDNILDFFNVHTFFRLTGNFYSPIGVTSQDAEYKMLHKFFKTSLECIENDMKENEYEDY